MELMRYGFWLLSLVCVCPNVHVHAGVWCEWRWDSHPSLSRYTWSPFGLEFAHWARLATQKDEGSSYLHHSWLLLASLLICRFYSDVIWLLVRATAWLFFTEGWWRWSDGDDLNQMLFILLGLQPSLRIFSGYCFSSVLPQCRNVGHETMCLLVASCLHPFCEPQEMAVQRKDKTFIDVQSLECIKSPLHSSHDQVIRNY